MYNPNWKQEYTELKGWDNMSSGPKYLATHPCNSSAMGMRMKDIQKELEEMKSNQATGNS